MDGFWNTAILRDVTSNVASWDLMWQFDGINYAYNGRMGL